MSFTSRDDRTLRGRMTQRVSDQMMEETAWVASGQATSYEDYRFRIGRLEAMNQMLKWIDDIVADLNAGPLRD